MRRGVIVLGLGGHAAVITEILKRTDMEIIGFTDSAGRPKGVGPQGMPVLGGDEVLDEYDKREILLANGIGSVGPAGRRDEVFTRLQQKGFRFVSIIHPQAIIATNVALGHGVQVMAGAVIQTGTVIGDNTVINTSSVVDHDCVLGRSVHIAPGAVLSGSVRVGDCTHIGVGARVIQQIRIGAHTLVGPGITVLDDVPMNSRLHPTKTSVWMNKV